MVCVLSSLRNATVELYKDTIPSSRYSNTQLVIGIKNWRLITVEMFIQKHSATLSWEVDMWIQKEEKRRKSSWVLWFKEIFRLYLILKDYFWYFRKIQQQKKLLLDKYSEKMHFYSNLCCNSRQNQLGKPRKIYFDSLVKSSINFSKKLEELYH